MSSSSAPAGSADRNPTMKKPVSTASSRTMLLFITGWPACGQSFYGEWLAAHHGFRHIDLDQPLGDPDGFRNLWEERLPGRAGELAAALGKQHPRWVATGEIPVEHLDNLAPLAAAGFNLWFLLPRTESVSRLTWLQRERELDADVRPTAWDKQASAIRGSARRLRPFFRDHCVTTLNAAHELMDAAEFAAHVGVLAKA